MNKEEIAKLIANKVDIIAMKKGVMKFCDPVINLPIKDLEEITKAVSGGTYPMKDGMYKDDCLYVKGIANTYNIMDSHGDVHVSGCFTKSIQENQSRIFHLQDHKQFLGGKIGNMLSVSEQTIKFKQLGININGSTTAIVFESEVKDDYSKQAYDAYKNNEILNHSVAMIYVNVELAVNDANFPDEFKVWNKVFPLLGNPDDALAEGMFWVVREAKLKEVSALLWNGSNRYTPTLEVTPVIETDNTNKEVIEPIEVTHKEENIVEPVITIQRRRMI